MDCFVHWVAGCFTATTSSTWRRGWREKFSVGSEPLGMRSKKGRVALESALLPSGPVAQLDRAPASEAGGRAFESRPGHHSFRGLTGSANGCDRGWGRMRPFGVVEVGERQVTPVGLIPTWHSAMGQVQRVARPIWLGSLSVLSPNPLPHCSWALGSLPSE